ncbi:pteridine reductase [Amphritea pacifica]|uniref:pteridine reductase n=1 Tax=Amphritea pacifica TaxID=2811233 RepID=UPI0019641875|nr:pteridine reductase [Amphritea pacifica]
MTQPIALITGAGRRIGATITRQLWQQGYRVIIHCHNSTEAAAAIAQELNLQRADSARVLQADLNSSQQVSDLASNALSCWGRIDLLVNNASSFYPTPIDQSTDQQWDDLINSNLKAAYFLAAKLSPSLRQQQGNIINIVDIHAQRALPGYPIYSIAKAGLQMMTLALAKELAPEVRVNGVSPGPILWPEQEAEISAAEQQAILNKTLLKRIGRPEDIAQTVLFLASQNFITGQIIAVDGGKSLYSH